MEIAQEAEAVLVAISEQLEEVRSITSTARARFRKASGLLHEDIHGASTVAADALAVVPALNVRDREDTAAAARLVASVFSEKPVLPGAIDAAMDLVACVTGPLQRVRGLLSTMSDNHDRVRNLFLDCIRQLGIGDDDERREAWRIQWSKVILQGLAVDTRVIDAISEAGDAGRVHRLYEMDSPHRGQRMKEAWKLEGIVRTAIQELDAALVAVGHMHDAIASEIHVINAAAAPPP
uniref:Uncharacterized protein n=1 Tax=Leersia perrieri TaxID=77586 RepID=A0A0D9VVC5_9ORYZ